MSEDVSSRVRLIFDGSFEFLGLLSPDGTVLEANQTALSYINAERGDVVGTPFWDAGWWREDSDKARLREAVFQAAAGAFVRLDLAHSDHDGKQRTFDFSLKPVHDADGKVSCLIAEGRDVEEYVQSHSRFRELLEAAPDAILEVGSHGGIVLMNNAAERLFGYSRDELLGRSVDLLVPDALRETHTGHRRNYAAHPTTRPMGTNLSLRALRKDGSEVPVEISLSPIRAADRFHVIAIVRDVTERHRADAQLRELNRELELRNAQVERSNRLKSEFLASMSHELRSPLHTIIGFAELLGEELEGPLNEKQQRFVRNIHQDSHHLLAIINDLLDISKIEAGRMEIHIETFDLATVIDEVLTTVEQQAAVKSLRIEKSWPASAVVDADRVRFKQILLNLLTNAIKFTPEGGRIEIKARPRDRRMAVSVSDTGVGIARADHDAIFDTFYQVGSTTRGVREGTGLGLAITKKLVEQQGGQIWVESELGEGSVFLFTVGSKVPAARPLVLIVEPEGRAAELLVNYLEPEGFDAIRTRSAEKALSMAIGLGADAVIVDVGTPAGDEWTLIRELRTNDQTAQIPVILVSVTDEDNTVRSLGVRAHLTKPVGKKVLIDALSRCVEPSAKAGEILVVDDEARARDLLCEFLAEAGYRCHQADSGGAAIDYLARARPVAMILDLAMPGMSGFEVLARLRENAEWAAIPVVVMTGLELQEGDVQLLKQTAVAILTKGQSWKKPLLESLQKTLRPSRVRP